MKRWEGLHRGELWRVQHLLVYTNLNNSHIREATDQSLFPPFPPFCSTQRDTLPVASNFDHGVGDMVRIHAEHRGSVRHGAQEGIYRRPSGERNSAQVVDESCVNLCDQSTRWVTRVMPERSLEFIESERRKVQRDAGTVGINGSSGSR